jgi:hypothetical protein
MKFRENFLRNREHRMPIGSLKARTGKGENLCLVTLMGKDE